MYRFDNSGKIEKSIKWDIFNRKHKEYEEAKKEEFKNLSPEEQADYENAKNRFLELSRKGSCKTKVKDGKFKIEFGELTDEEEREEKECFRKMFSYDRKVEARLRARGIEMPDMPYTGPDYFLRA